MGGKSKSKKSSTTTSHHHKSSSVVAGAGAGGGGESANMATTPTSVSSSSSENESAKMPEPVDRGQGQPDVSPSSISTSTSGNPNTDEDKGVAAYLECKICLDVCASPICNCPNGHLICGICFDKLAAKGVPSCPLKCEGHLTPCVFAERLSREIDLKLECQFKESGCSEPIKATVLKSHIKDCENRDIMCTRQIEKRACNAVIPMLKYSQHLVDVHKKSILESKSCGRFITEPFIEGNQKALDYWKGLQPYDSLLIRFDGHTFFLHLVTRDDAVHWWFTILGSTQTAEKYEAETRVMQVTGKKIRDDDTITLNVLPFHKCATFNKFSGSYATISAARVTQFCMEKSIFDPRNQIFKISWNIVAVSASPVERLKGQKRKAEDELEISQ